MKKLLVLTILLISANCFSQPFKSVEVLLKHGADSLLKLTVTDPTLKGAFEMLVVTCKNTSATLYDTAVFRHINDKGDTTFPMFRKLRPNSYPVVWGADTLKDTLIVPPLTTIDVLIWKPFPYIMEAFLINHVYNLARRLKLTGTYSRKY